MKRVSAALLLTLLCACGDDDTPVICPLPVVFAPLTSLQVAVVDSVTGQSLVPGARGRWIAGTETDSLRDWGGVLAAFGPAGRYAVAVEAPGYRAWARSDVRVRNGDCAPVPTELTARLVPEVHPPVD
jgi:hypothetical protein